MHANLANIWARALGALERLEAAQKMSGGNVSAVRGGRESAARRFWSAALGAVLVVALLNFAFGA